MSIADLRRALARSRIPIELLGLTYALSLLVGIGMVQMGNGFALHARDRIVARAHAADPSAIGYARGSRWRAAMLDASRNLGLGAIPETVGGLGIFLPYPAAAYRGWVGGIVSVGSTHVSRLTEPRQAAYYVITIILQLIPYSLAGGAGVMLGLSYYASRRAGKSVERWLTLPAEAVRDVARVYALVVPLFLIASLWEFLSPWN